VKGTVRVDQVASFKRVTGPATIQHFNRLRAFTLRVNIQAGSSQGAITNQIIQNIKDLHMDPGYTYQPVGGAREFQRMLRNFAIALLLSAIFMYLVIAAQFESFVHALAIMMTLPLTAPFAIISVMLTRDSLNLFSLLGLLVLLGVVKKNAILQIDRANQLRGMGMPLIEATVQASKDRLRPILMTTLAFVAGMAPLVFSSGTGSATNRTAGGVIVGGQTLSLLLTLIAAPVFYVLLDSMMSWARRHLGMGHESPTAMNLGVTAEHGGHE
jgi:HAE1 family hydrophobic/amphiphilic exporter-1